ncbi:hypothetical protein [Pelomonas sp. KK5]|uniref:hypothetical protein n=1 Tax=Pelomonas sp. KK5 TaxID=1855730 RepID=UPI00097BB27E|nr:hypothetical protein [Pelomonas sp. KK5]
MRAAVPSPLTEFDGQPFDGLVFCARVYALFESIRGRVDGPSRMRRRPSKVEKRLLEELLPIAKYVQASYRPGRYITVRWVDGSQSFDAQIEQRGAYVDHGFYPALAHLEATCAMHPNEYLSRELLDTEGSTFGLEGIRRLQDGTIESVPVSYMNREFVDKFTEILRKRIEAKAAIVYPEDTILIVQCTLNMPYLPDEWGDLMSRISIAVPPSSFREIYFYDPVGQYSQSLFPRKRESG